MVNRDFMWRIQKREVKMTLKNIRLKIAVGPDVFPIKNWSWERERN